MTSRPTPCVECTTAPSTYGSRVVTLGSISAAPAAVGTQECTQIGENGLSEPFRGICVHCYAAVMVVGTQECTQIGDESLSAPVWGICVHC